MDIRVSALPHLRWAMEGILRIMHVTMIIHRSDRYILSEMVGPFLVSLSGLLLFILLNLILSLSDLMVDRGVGIATLIHLVVLKLPSLLVLALPMSSLFATFLGLGRLVHDREVIAFQAAGISLRRILLPILIAATLIAGVDFALYNWAVPSSEHLYQQTLREIIFRGGVPHVRANTFFKGQEGEFFYVRSYDEKTKVLNEVLVYDVTGKLFPQAKSAVTILTAESGLWKGNSWVLDRGKVYGYDHDGTLTYTGNFSTLEIAAGQIGPDLLFGSRTPSEMGIGELREQIALLRKSGAAVDDLIVECNLKVAMPVATLVFVLFGGAASLIFGWRSRAVGVVISFVLVGLFQGIMLWTQTLGRRGIISPPLGAWFPDILFGAIGIALFLQLDRFHRPAMWKHIRRMIPFFLILIASVGIAYADNVPIFAGQIDPIPQTVSEPAPLNISCDALTISSDHRHVKAQGNVRLSYEKTVLTADTALVDERGDNEWRLQASGNVHLTVEDDFTLSGERMDTILSFADNSLTTQQATASVFSGRSSFVNSNGETHTLVYAGDEGAISYNEDGSLSLIEITDATLTTCDCCGGAMRAQPYSIETGRLILYPDQLIVAFNLTVRSFGTRVFWLPVYVQPLKETLDSPLFPAIGNSGLHGWFFKWNIPFYLNKDNYGALLFDYFSRFQEVGLGAVLRYAFAGQQGSINGYYFPAKVGDSKLDLSLTHTATLPNDWKMTGSATYHQQKATHDLTFSSSTSGPIKEWNFALSASRSKTEKNDQVRIDERLPELTLSRSAFMWGDLSITPHVSVGWFSEWAGDVLTGSSLRADGSITLRLNPRTLLGFSITPIGSLRLTSYEAGAMTRRREAHSFSVSLSRPGMEITYDYQEINGESPFAFDHLVGKNHISLGLATGTELALRMSGGIDLAHGTVDLLQLRVEWSPGAKITLATTYDIPGSAFTHIDLSGKGTYNNVSVEWAIPYDAKNDTFESSMFSLHAGSSETGTVSLSGEFDLNKAKLSQLTLETEMMYGTEWGISLGGQVDMATQAIVNPSFGLFHDFYDCLRVGIERRSGQVWIYTSVLAFPEAILRYAPSSTQVEVGK